MAFVLGDDAGLMVRAFSATVGDSQLLVQRAMLDLMASLPIDAGKAQVERVFVDVSREVGD